MRELRRRSLTATTETEAVPESVLTAIKGIGSAVAQRVLQLITNKQTFEVWNNPEKLAASVNGLSAQRAAVILKTLSEFFGSTESSPILTVDFNPEMKEASKPENPMPGIPDEILKSMLPSMNEEMQGKITVWLNRNNKKEEEKEEPVTMPQLPEEFKDVPIQTLKAIVPNLQGAAKDQVQKYLQFLDEEEENAEYADDEPESQTNNVPAKTSVKEPNEEEMLSYFVGEHQRYTSRSGKIPYLKLTGGKNRVRLLPPKKPGPPFQVLKIHTFRFNGRFTSTVDLQWLLYNERLLNRAVEEGKLNDEDVRKISALGDPMQALPIRLQEADRKEEAKNLWAKTRYLWNVLNREDGKVYVWESSKSFFESLMSFNERQEVTGGILTVHPKLFDITSGNDLSIAGNGQDGQQRRYLAPIALPSSPAGIYSETYDLESLVIGKVMGFKQKAELLFNMHGQLANSVGMLPNTWLV